MVFAALALCLLFLSYSFCEHPLEARLMINQKIAGIINWLISIACYLCVCPQTMCTMLMDICMYIHTDFVRVCASHTRIIINPANSL